MTLPSFPTLMEAFPGVGRVKQATDISEVSKGNVLKEEEVGMRREKGER